MKSIIIIIVVVIIGFAVYFFTTNNTETSTNGFNNPKKAAHYESNTPEHGATLSAAPINIVIDFNFNLTDKSSISITQDGNEFASGSTTIDDNKLSMRRNMDQSAPDGQYTVMYEACWPDNSCHDGQFQFAIDRSLTSSYTDLRGQSEVTIQLAAVQFVPMDIIVSKDTTIIWQNDDEVAHFVNTDSHPAHTYFLPQNSQELNKGDTFKQVFDTPGIYPYHCSAHASTMVGSIIVE